MCIMISITCAVLFIVLLLLGPIHSVVISRPRKKTVEEFDKTNRIISVCTLVLYGIIIVGLISFPFLHTCQHCQYDGDFAHSEGCLCLICKPHEENCSCDNCPHDENCSCDSCFLKYYYKSVKHGTTCTCDDCTRFYEITGGI